MIKMKLTRKRLILAVAMMLPFLLLSAHAFGQSAGVSGTVTDASGAVLPGTTVTATNAGTGVKATATTNNAGIFNFASLPIGTYTVSAELPGFQTTKKTDVSLAVGAQLRINFELKVSGIATQVEVTSSAADMILESTSSTGTVMNDKTAKDLPLIGNDVMQLVNVMGGVVKSENTIFGNSNQSFAGVMANDINITRDGISVNDARYSSGIVSPARINPEMIGEFRLILTPVDAEMGRGAGQVQVLTKSGGNEYHGSAVWSNINTAFDAKEWNDNRLGLTPMWKNVNQYTLSAGGPIIKNKTFFFVSWDHNIARKRENVSSLSLTPCARKGIYRYWPGWIPGNADATISRTNNSQTRPSVKKDGTPLTPTDNRDGTAYTGVLQYASVLGQLSDAAKAQIALDPINCSNYTFTPTSTGVVAGTNWDTYRKAYDTSGYTEKFTAMMPQANYWSAGDGLNTAALRWTRTTKGEDTVYGSGMDSARKSITIKIDHNLTEKHRISGTFSWEKSFSTGENEPTWPNGYGGAIDRRPKNVQASVTSTLRPTLLNEFRFGLAYNYNRTIDPLNNPATGKKLESVMQEVLPTAGWSTWDSLPVLVVPGTGTTRFANNTSNFYGGRAVGPATWGSNDFRWTYSDTLTWTLGSHSLKFGADLRSTLAQSNMDGVAGFGDDPNWWPYAFGGATSYSPAQGVNPAIVTGLVGNNYSAYTSPSGSYGGLYDLMNYTAGSLQKVSQYYFVNTPTATSWSDPTTPEGRIRKLRAKQLEFSFFLKDDWKVNSDLTLNLGLRYEYYGVPHNLDGMTIGIVGGGNRLFGGQAGGFDQWLRGTIDGGVPAFDPTNLTQMHFIGPDSPNPDESLFNKDRNNWGPAVGFAWQLPWFGKGKTTLRGGYQISYSQISRLDPNGGMMAVAGSQPGVVYAQTYQGTNEDKYLDIAHMESYSPTMKIMPNTGITPLSTRPLTDGQSTAYGMDPNIRNPYIQSLTLALTRQIGSSLTVDVRYIGTLSRKGVATVNLNANQWLRNGLKEAYDAARRGGESALLDKLMPPGAYCGYCGPVSGAAQLRGNYLSSTDLANGNYDSLTSGLATNNGTFAGVPAGVQGELVRRSGLGENFIKTNRQFSSANYMLNRSKTNYHSLQTQVTLRPTHGLNFTATYTWSKMMGNKGDNTDPLNPDLDYGIMSNNRAHQLTTYGTYNLPLGGPNGYLFRDSAGWVKRIAEGWQLSWVTSNTSGLPMSVTSIATMYGGSNVDLVNPALFNGKDGHSNFNYVDAGTGRISGRYFDEKYVQVADPGCSSTYVAASLQATCNLNIKALALASDPTKIVFQRAMPGVMGNYPTNTLVSPGRWSVDMALSKDVKIMEGKSFNFRVDVNNIFNHPTPSGTAPSSYDQRTFNAGAPLIGLNTTTTPFGYIGYKVGHRVFSAKLRFTF